MKLKNLFASLLLLPALVWGQVTPVIPNNTVLGNFSGATSYPRSVGSSCTTMPITGLQSLCRLVDVMAYGALCDGTTDDTASIQNAVNSLATGYGTVLFPDAKTCKITSTVTGANNGVVLQGAGEFSSFIDFEPSVSITAVTITGTAGQFACTCTRLAVGQVITISGTYGGTGSITGYANPTKYYVSATNGTSTFTLKALAASQFVNPAAIVTTAGTPTGLTYTLSALSAFRFAGNGIELFNSGMAGITIYSHDTTYTKTAIETVDQSGFSMEHVVVGISGGLWTGGAAIGPDTQNGSIGFRSRGRENAAVRNFSGEMDRPIVFSINPNSINTQEDVNQFHFTDIYLIQDSALGGTQGSGPIIYVDDGVSLTTLFFDGYQAWVGGTYGFYMSDTLGSASSLNVVFRNVIKEQTTSATAYTFYLNLVSAQMQQMVVDTAAFDTGMKGAFLTGCHFCTFLHSTFASTTKEWLTLSATDYNTSWESMNIADGATETLTGNTIIDAIYSPDNATIPLWAHLLHSGQVATPNYGFGSGTVRVSNIWASGFGGASFTAAGTGACATRVIQNGGNQAGLVQCTGTTGASTLTLTMVAAPTAYTCWGRDVTTPTTLTQTGSLSTTQVTLTMTSVAANDNIQFGCLGY